MIIIRKRYTAVLFLIVIALIFASGCAKKTTIILLPDPSGKVGNVTVYNEAGSIDITQARESTVVKGRDLMPGSPVILSSEAIEVDFSSALSTLPLQPVHFLLFFERESTELITDSMKTLSIIIELIINRNSQNISVVGHTDTVGDQPYNLQLSRERASAISGILVEAGVDSTYIKTTSHGEMFPLIKTADDIHEPRNRRVEVVVR